MEWEPEIKDSGYLPEKGKPTEETVICPLSSRQVKYLKFSADDAYISI